MAAQIFTCIPCPLCGSHDYHVRYKASINPSSEEEKNPGCFRCTSHELAQHPDIVQCRHCGILFNNPQPTIDALESLYKEVEDPLYLQETEARQRTFHRSLCQLHRHTPAKPPGHLLDVGCYTGVFMKTAAAAGWKTEGIELSSWAAQIAHGLDVGHVYDKPLEQLELPPDSFDVVTLWDVIEHLQNPAALLKNINRVLKRGGVLALSTHMVDSWAARLLGTRYPFFMHMHMVHFSRKTVRRLLEKEGFRLLCIKSHHRILRTGYFFEKLEHRFHRTPVLSPVVRWFSSKKWLSGRFIRIGLLGLANIYAEKM